MRAGGGHTVDAQIRKPGIGRAEFDWLAADITRPFCDRVEGWSDPSPGATTGAGVAPQVLVLGRRKRA